MKRSEYRQITLMGIEIETLKTGLRRRGYRKAVQEAVPEAAQEAVPEAVQEGVPEAAQEGAPAAVQEEAPAAVQEAVPEAAQEAVPEAVQEEAPAAVQELDSISNVSACGHELYTWETQSSLRVAESEAALVATSVRDSLRNGSFAAAVSKYSRECTLVASNATVVIQGLPTSTTTGFPIWAVVIISVVGFLFLTSVCVLLFVVVLRRRRGQKHENNPSEPTSVAVDEEAAETPPAATAGAEDLEQVDAGDVSTNESEFLVWTPPNALAQVTQVLRSAGVEVTNSELVMVPKLAPPEVSGIDRDLLDHGIEQLNALDDVDRVYTTLDPRPESLL
ncbi:Translational activator of mitochondrially encoded cytochrome c oxidase I [Cyanidiococcus yangmingshanensis]|uniref:Translational activator of mitochondrially encoded cytochrome c oxidase I n=1 Tax=Cyanidiococcus yangmingshanensis TaxID=2690220 RepID=A0A7J7IJE3_9RHOD|nr:Translational activator of mitochondrially encoded cytochrome c oxidase I [Cyanidiococcus yangmingshanensis]